jgi:hypothetical protein
MPVICKMTITWYIIKFLSTAHVSTMKKAALLLPVIALSGCLASSGTVKPTQNQNDSRECARNFTYDGSFLSGRTFKTNVFVQNVKQDQAMQRAARYIIADGWQVNNTDSKLGIISASQTVSYGNGKTAPLNVGIEQAKGGVKVNIAYSISGGVTSPVDAVQNFFCSTVQAIEGR